MFSWSLFSWDPWLCLCENIECRYSDECNCSYYRLIFITRKYNAMNKSWLWPQKLLRPKMFLSLSLPLLIKHLFKRRDLLHIKCLVEKLINQLVLIWTITFNVKQVKQKPLKVCLTWKVVRFGILHLSRLKKYQHAFSNPVYHQHLYLVVHSFVFSENAFHWELLEFVFLILKTTIPW